MRASITARADCPLAPPALETTYVRVLHRACLIVGGLNQLAEHLKVPELALRTWMEGREEPPETAFLAAIDILLLYADTLGCG